MTWTLVYIGSIVLVNWGFAHMPGYELLWSSVVGTVFITRDMAQRRVGRWWVLAAMAVAGVVSYVMASPVVALASVAAFAVSELADWAVFTFTKKPLAERILYSSAVSTPIDSVLFLGLLGILQPSLVAAQIASKMAPAFVVWAALRVRPV